MLILSQKVDKMTINSTRKKVTPLDFYEMKKNSEKITVLTAYDYPMAKTLDEAGIDALLVGDSMGMVIYGYSSTLPVEVDDIIRHTQAVARASTRSMVIGDMPFMSFSLDEDAVRNAGKMVKIGNADAIKLEGGREREKAIRLMVDCGIAVMGHIGLTPTYIHQFGGFKVQGKTAQAAERLIEDAKILEEAGVFSIVLETIPWKIAKEITERVNVPTIGIGAGPYCDGQVLVSQDMMGFSEAVYFKHVKKYGDVHEVMKNSAESYLQEVKDGTFPTTEQSHEISEEEFDLLLSKLNNSQ
jgi:3-methyl-2-oxobutanoate hydroxymethyltransferase